MTGVQKNVHYNKNHAEQTQTQEIKAVNIFQSTIHGENIWYTIR